MNMDMYIVLLACGKRNVFENSLNCCLIHCNKIVLLSSFPNPFPFVLMNRQEYILHVVLKSNVMYSSYHYILVNVVQSCCGVNSFNYAVIFCFYYCFCFQFLVSNQLTYIHWLNLIICLLFADWMKKKKTKNNLKNL